MEILSWFENSSVYWYLSAFEEVYTPSSYIFSDVSLCTQPNMAVNSLILLMTNSHNSNRQKAINDFWTQLPFNEVCYSCPVKKSPETVMIQSNKIKYRLQ